MENKAGKGLAVASFVLGVIAIICWIFRSSAVGSLICGIIGVVLSCKAEQAGMEKGIRKAGYTLSMIGLIGGVVALAFATYFGLVTAGVLK